MHVCRKRKEKGSEKGKRETEKENEPMNIGNGASLLLQTGLMTGPSKVPKRMKSCTCTARDMWVWAR